MTSPTLFEGPVHFEPELRDSWVGSLTRHWISLTGRSPADLPGDLSALAPLFASGASAKNVKARVFDLPQVEASTPDLPSSLVLELDGSTLITPEGRILLQLLLQLQLTGQSNIDIERQNWAWATSSSLRTEWHARWLHKQFDSSISAPVLGAALFLIINGSIEEQRALLMPSDNERDRELGHIVMPVIAAFSGALGGAAPDSDIGLRQHWVFTQVTRLLGRDVAREKVNQGSRIWVRRERERHLIENLAQRLNRVADPARRYTAVHSLLDGYRQARGRLAALGQMHEDPTTTRRVTKQLLAADGLS